ncbi:FUSC family protein [Nocardioides euryhalodurans]|nr:aromatic acid exporter family protein [Nocardioides euryhalodurans]
MGGHWGDRLRDPVFWSDVVQLFKTVVAAVIAWVLAATTFDLPQPFLAPWAAILVVHATVYRTFSRGLRQVAAAVLAVLLAALVGNLLGLDTVAVAVLIVLALGLGSLPWFGTETTTIATTALVVLTTGFSDDTRLLSRLLDTGIGIAVGLAVNVVVWPPLRRRTAIVAMNRIDDGIGELLVDIGTALDQGGGVVDVAGWIERTRDLDEELDQAWALVRQARESARMNPRRAAHEFRDPTYWTDLLRRMEQAVAETRSMVRTLGGPLNPSDSWEPAFAGPWTSLLVAAGQAVADADPGEIGAVRTRLEHLVDELSAGGRSGQWPVHGALLINLRNIIDAMDEVAAANPLGQPPVPLSRLRRRPAGGPGPAA